MAKLTMGTDGALALQRKIQTELAVRGYSSETDPVMAEYITIMVINDKTAEQINTELADLIGPDYESNFTDWLFLETAKAAAIPALPPTSPKADEATSESHQEETQLATPGHRGSGGAGLLQSALSSVHPPTRPSASRHNVPQSSSGAQKRTASARSPSPSSSGPNKVRRTDTPTGPRAMIDRALGTGSTTQSGRSLIDRMSGPARRGNMGGAHGNLSPSQVSHIQAKIDGITGNQMPPMNGPGLMPMNGSPPMNFSLQEMMMMNWDMMRQMANTMGMIAPNMGGPVPAVGGFGFPQPGMQPPPMANFIGAPPFVPAQQGGRGGGGQNRGGLAGGRGRGNGNNGHPVGQVAVLPQPQSAPAPVSTPEAPNLSTSATVPERPGTPSLCKYALKCTNPQCKFSHPSPVATVESGVVLSTEFCPKGKNCKDKDCTFGHVSPSVINGSIQKPTSGHQPAVVPAPAASQTACKFGVACTRPGCIFTHPPNFRPPHSSSQPNQASNAIPCRFGTSCTRGDCPFQHPKGHVAANMFYRGIGSDAPLVEGYVSPHRSVRFGLDPKLTPLPTGNAEKESEKKDGKEAEGVALGKDKVENAVDVGA
ncbi:hypothetical protein BU17DRAFT_83565 [Hysterangium stoloniferum]|nr:hypothetical protein BU17DRAFT_83565 [Hysterangium stoloniferum]